MSQSFTLGGGDIGRGDMLRRHTILYIGGQTLGEAGTCDVTQSFTL
ncbi:unnamed protein product, partial [Staurois parvus]